LVSFFRDGDNPSTSSPFFRTVLLPLPILSFFAVEKFDAFVKSPKTLFSVIPAEAGIQSLQGLLDSRLRGSDDREGFLRSHQVCFKKSRASAWQTLPGGGLQSRQDRVLLMGLL